jgi:hypothetical protein
MSVSLAEEEEDCMRDVFRIRLVRPPLSEVSISRADLQFLKLSNRWVWLSLLSMLGFSSEMIE